MKHILNTLTRSAAIVAVGLVPTFAFSAGSEDSTSPPKTTKTTKKCWFGKVWDKETQKCVKPDESGYSQEGLINAVRELAYAGRYEDAQTVLAAMADQQDDRVLTYWGFTHRKLGDVTLGMAFYNQAIAQNPDNILARSYMGQAHVLAGEVELASLQLTEIQQRGGTGTWAEQSLSKAITTGETFSY